LRLCQVSDAPEPLPLKYRAVISYSHADTGFRIALTLDQD
jgi:hypothetical protein